MALMLFFHILYEIFHKRFLVHCYFYMVQTKNTTIQWDKIEEEKVLDEVTVFQGDTSIWVCDMASHMSMEMCGVR